jgi:tripartite-type tricarboxylate transporter receptor subunit TctC
MKRLIGLLLVAFASGALAQAYPSKPVRIVVAFTPGSSTDIIGRAVAAKLQEMWGQPVVVENRAGAGGTVGSEFVLRTDPDGYTLLANSSAHAANPGLYKEMRYDTMKDFVNLALLGGGPNVLMVSPETGWKTLADFVKAAKAAPGKLNFASAGMGSGTHFNLEKLKIATAIDVQHIPYKGTPEAIGDTIANRTCCYWAPLNAALPHVNGGKAVALAISSAQRSPLLPNVPSVAEQGYQGFDYTLWVGLWGRQDQQGRQRRAGQPGSARAADQARHGAGQPDDSAVHRFREKGNRRDQQDPAGRRDQAAIVEDR